MNKKKKKRMSSINISRFHYYFIYVGVLVHTIYNIYTSLTVAAGFPPTETHSMVVSTFWMARMKSPCVMVGFSAGTITVNCVKRDRIPG